MTRHRLRYAGSVALALALCAACGTTVSTTGGVAANSLTAPTGVHESGVPGSEGLTAANSIPGGAAAGATASGGSSTAATLGGTASGVRTVQSASTGISTETGSDRAITGAEPVTIGIAYPNDGAAAYSAIGVKGRTSSAADTEAAFTAMAHYMNDQGGLAGHPVKLLFYGYSIETGTFASQAQAMCSYFTEDHHVFAVIETTDSMDAGPCFKQHHTIFIDAFNGEHLDEPAVRALLPYYFRPFMLNLSRIAIQIDGLYNAGFFTAGSRIGLLRWNTSYETHARNQQIVPALQRHGLALTSEYTYAFIGSFSDLGQTEAETNNAILRFRSANINKVVFLGSEGVFPLFFMLSAESQSYRPDYGFSSLDTMSFQPGNVPNAQLEHATGVGWNLLFDLDQYGTSRSADDSPAWRQCRQVLEKAGFGNPDGFDCDTLFWMKAAIDRAPAVTATGLVAGINGLAKSFQSAETFGLDFTGVHPEGIASARIVRFRNSCSCLYYTGPAFVTP